MNSDVSRLMLLEAFDAVQKFIDPAALANLDGGFAFLASAMQRTRGGPPLDQAMWSDWLDAALAVNPDWIAVREARALIQQEHEEFVRAWEAKAPKSKLDALRAKSAQRTWDIVGALTITAHEGYEMLREYLRAFWERGLKSDREVEDLLRRLSDAPAQNWALWLAAIDAIKGQPSAK